MVNLEEEVEIDDLAFAKYQLFHVNKRIADVKQDLYAGDDFDSPHELSPEDIEEESTVMLPHGTISDCQLIIELSAKTIFKSLGINPVEKHNIEFSNDRVSGALSRVRKEDDLFEKVARVMFLIQFWEKFYTLSKYGLPEQNISAFQIMDTSDALRALQDADFCQQVATDVHDMILEEKDIEFEDLDIDMYRHVNN